MNDPSLCRLIANPYRLKPLQPPVNYSQSKSKEYIQRFLRSEYKDLYHKVSWISYHIKCRNIVRLQCGLHCSKTVSVK